MEPKIVNFPTKAKRIGPKSDDELVADIMRAHRKLGRAIQAARGAGLKVASEDWNPRPPKVVREY